MKRIGHFGLVLTLAVWGSGCRATDPTGIVARDGGGGGEALAPGPDGADGAHADLDDARVLDQAQERPEAADAVAEGADLREAGGALGQACVEGAQRTCVSPANPQVGACHAGVQRCEGGAWGPCSEVLPAADERCNAIDDNCNGMTDEGCAAGCLVVCANCPGGAADGAVADGSPDRPFTTLEEAIAAVGRSPIDGGTRRRICVAGGTSCEDSWAYRSDAPITIGDGLIVQGSYAVTPTGLVYCDSTPRPKTTLEFTSNEGVRFDSSVVRGAELSGFAVAVTASGPTDATVAIAVTGARNVSLSRVFIGEGLGGGDSYGVRILAGGEATIIGSAISAGQGRGSAFGVYVDGGTVNLRNNCNDLVAGHCAKMCGDCGFELGIRGYLVANATDAPARASAVYIAGGTGSNVVGNLICGGSIGLAPGASPAASAAMVCEGPGCGTVSGNVIGGGSADEVVGLALIGADPWVHGNHVEGGCGVRTTTGLWLEGSSARLQNNRILGGRCAGSGAPVFHGVRWKAGGTTDHPDLHSNDIEPLGFAADCQSVGVLVEGSSGSARPASGEFRNNIISAGECGDRSAIREVAGAGLQALVNNDLYDPVPESSSGAAVLYHHGDGDATTAAQVNARPGASGNLSADPKYAAYRSDFHLTAGSACIDQGVADRAPDTDADENKRPIGAGHDIGAYEFQE